LLLPLTHNKSAIILKNIILIVLLLIGHNSFSQDGLLPLDANKQVVYTDSGKPELSKNEIFKKAQEWVGKTFGNYENAVTFEDPQVGKLVLTSYAPVPSLTYEYVRFDLTIECTDKQYTVRIDQLDGVSAVHSPQRLGAKDNAAIMEKEVAVKTEQNRKKRTEAEEALKNAKSDLEGINNAMYRLLSGLKVSLTSNGG
jgi:NACalpha-BTF3-like transcription factor